MKRQVLIILLAVTLVFAASAQGVRGEIGAGSPDSAPAAQQGDPTGKGQGDILRQMDRLRLQSEECDKICDMLKEQEGELIRTRAELREMQARTARLMLEERVDRPEIERTLKRSSELEQKVRMIRVDWHIQIKAMLGPERWAIMYKLAQMTQAAERAGRLGELLANAEDPEQTRLLLQILKDLY